MSFFYRQKQEKKKGETHRERERAETVESVTRANRITLYFPPDEGGGIVVMVMAGKTLRRKKVGG